MEPYLKLRAYKDSDGYQQIQLCYFSYGKMLLINSTVKTKKEYWDKEKQKIVSRAKEIDQDVSLLNQILREKLQKISTIVIDFTRKYNVSPKVEYVREEFLKEGKKIIEAREVKQEYENWIKEAEKQLKYSKIYYTVLSDLKEFHPGPLYYQDLTLIFFNKLKIYLLDKVPPIQNSTIIKRLKCFKTFLHEKFKSGENEYDFYKKFKHKLKEVKKPPIHIPTQQEFEILINYPLNNTKLDDARDLYIIGCTTGLRYSDVVRITPQNVVGDNLIADITKTGESQLLIPLNDISIRFLNKQFGKYGRVKDISNQKLNAALIGLLNPKKPNEPPEGGLFRIISEQHLNHPFSEIVNDKARYGGKTVLIPKPKWQTLTFHSSRKFFISYLVNIAHVDVGNVMEWSGHSTYQSINKYIQKGQNQKEIMQEAFKRNS